MSLLIVNRSDKKLKYYEHIGYIDNPTGGVGCDKKWCGSYSEC